MTNISSELFTLSHFLSVISQPARIQILCVLAKQEACVCHLEAAIGRSQASISQHLMYLRKRGLVTTRRDGRHVYYQLEKTVVIDSLRQSAAVIELDPVFLDLYAQRPIPGCCCPQCAAVDEQKTSN